MMRLADDRPFIRSLPDRRVLSRVMLTQGEHRGLIAFGSADNHLHGELIADRRTAGDFCNYVESALRRLLGLLVPFERARIRPLVDQRHAYSTFFYSQRQDERHELELDWLREGTSLPDFLGLRVLSSTLWARARAALPRLRISELAGLLPVDPTSWPAVDWAATATLDALADAAAGAFALTDLLGRTRAIRVARLAAVHAAEAVRTSALADALQICVREVNKLRADKPDARAVEAVRRQLAFRAALGRNGMRGL